jgi:uncharacterized membrane protein
MKAPLCVVVSLVCLTTLNCSQTQAAQFIMLRDVLPNPASGTDSHPSVADISSDGSTVIGSYLSADGGRSFQWKIGVGVTMILDGSGQPITGPLIAVSADGSIVLGRDTSNAGKTYLWSEATGVHYINNLPVQPDMFALPRDMSGDGSAIVGNIVDFTQGSFKDTGGFIWNETNGLSIIPKFPVADSGALYATAISDDGSTVVGGQSASGGNDVTPVQWTQSLGTLSLGKINGIASGANSVSGDGSVILGDAVPGGQRFRWTQPTGWQSMGGLPGLGVGHTLTYNEVSANGEFIVGGQAVSDTEDDPIIWDETHSARSLRTLLEGATGMPLNNHNLGQAVQVSFDGGVIAGNGRDSTDAWVMVFNRGELVPEPSSLLLLVLALTLVLLKRPATSR